VISIENVKNLLYLLIRFFGEEPPMLRLFLQKLGYEVLILLGHFFMLFFILFVINL
jgi:hypothetical protein